MTDDRRNIKIRDEVFQALKRNKPIDWTWNHYLLKLLDPYDNEPLDDIHNRERAWSALHLYDSEYVSEEKAAELAGVSLTEFREFRVAVESSMSE